jgi:hypothetical protein
MNEREENKECTTTGPPALPVAPSLALYHHVPFSPNFIKRFLHGRTMPSESQASAISSINNAQQKQAVPANLMMSSELFRLPASHPYLSSPHLALPVKCTNPDGTRREPTPPGDPRCVVWMDIDNCLYSKDAGVDGLMKDKIEGEWAGCGCA